MNVVRVLCWSVCCWTNNNSWSCRGAEMMLRLVLLRAIFMLAWSLSLCVDGCTHTQSRTVHTEYISSLSGSPTQNIRCSHTHKHTNTDELRGHGRRSMRERWCGCGTQSADWTRRQSTQRGRAMTTNTVPGCCN